MTLLVIFINLKALVDPFMLGKSHPNRTVQCPTFSVKPKAYQMDPAEKEGERKGLEHMAQDRGQESETVVHLLRSEG